MMFTSLILNLFNLGGITFAIVYRERKPNPTLIKLNLIECINPDRILLAEIQFRHKKKIRRENTTELSQVPRSQLGFEFGQVVLSRNLPRFLSQATNIVICFSQIMFTRTQFINIKGFRVERLHSLARFPIRGLLGSQLED